MIDVIDTLEGLDALKQCWTAMEENVVLKVQQQFEWNRAGWVYFSSREKGARLRVLKWHQDGKNECVIFPFYLDGRGTLRFINDFHCDTQDVVYGTMQNYHYAFLEAIEWMMSSPDVKHILLKRAASGSLVLNYMSVLARGSVVYRDHAYSWLKLRMADSIADSMDHYKKKDRKKMATLLKRASEYSFKIYAKSEGEAFPKEAFAELQRKMIAQGRRRKDYLVDEIFGFSEYLYDHGLIEVALLSKENGAEIAAFRLVKGNWRMCWIVLYVDSHLPTLLHAAYLTEKVRRGPFVYDFGVGPYGYKLVTFKPETAPTFSIEIAKSHFGEVVALMHASIRYVKDYLKPIIRKEQA